MHRSPVSIIVFAPHKNGKTAGTFWPIDGDSEHPARDCDRRAAKCVEIFLEVARAHPGHGKDLTITYIDHDVLREDLDLNRHWARNSDPRRHLRDAIYGAIAAGRRVILAELHSFPAEWSSGRDDTKTAPQILVARREILDRTRAIVAAADVGRKSPPLVFEGTELGDIQAEFLPVRDHCVHLFIETHEDQNIISDADITQNFRGILQAALDADWNVGGPTDNDSILVGENSDPHPGPGSLQVKARGGFDLGSAVGYFSNSEFSVLAGAAAAIILMIVLIWLFQSGYKFGDVVYTSPTNIPSNRLM